MSGAIVKPPDRVWLWVCPKGHIQRAGIPDRRRHNVCWACYPGGRINNMERGPAEMVRFEYVAAAQNAIDRAHADMSERDRASVERARKSVETEKRVR